MTTTTPATATDDEAAPGAGAGAVDVDVGMVDAPPVNAKHLAAVLDAAWAAVTVTSDDKDHAKRTQTTTRTNRGASTSDQSVHSLDQPQTPRG